MKSLFFDTIAMAIIGLLVFLYLGMGLEAFFVFGVGLIGLRQARRLTSKKLQKYDANLNNREKST